MIFFKIIQCVKSLNWPCQTNISQVKFIRWDVANPIEIIPARNQKNILLIESVERNMSGLFNLNSVKARLDRAEAVQSELNTRQKIAHFFAEIDEGIKENLYHQSLEANIEFAWFNFGFWESLKEFKADFNLNFFGIDAYCWCCFIIKISIN